MDKLAKRLKQDAEQIDVQVSKELDRRIDASLRSVELPRAAAPRSESRPAIFWWASSLTGIAAALAVIGLLNVIQPPTPRSDATPPSFASSADTPMIRFRTESAMLTEPLRQELEDLQSDLKKAEEKVKQDIGL